MNIYNKIKIGEKRIIKAELDETGVPCIRMPPDPEELMEYFEKRFAYDGLPLIPPTSDRVDKMLKYAIRKCDEVILEVPPRKAELTIERLAANAVMAGCKPEYFPVLETAFEAMKAQEFNLRGMMATTALVWPAVIVSGDYSEKIKMNSGIGVFGPGYRANATIGRAITLTLITVGGAYPGIGTFSTMGRCGRYTFCFSEDTKGNPWEPLHTEKGYENKTTVTVLGALDPNFVVEATVPSEHILTLMSYHVALPASYTAYTPGEVGIVFGPHHIDRLKRDKWKKEEIKEFLYNNARIPFDLIKERGPHGGRYRGWPKWVSTYNGMVPVMKSPEDVIIVTAGGKTGMSSAVIPTWGGWTKSQTLPLENV